MTIPLTDPSLIDRSRIEEATELILGVLSDLHPDFDLHPGSAIYNLVIRPQALLHALALENIDRLRQSNTLQAVLNNPDLADSSLVDSLLSNYRIDRQGGTAAAGQVMMIFDRLAPVTIPASTVFTANGIRFQPTRAFLGVTTPENVLDAGSRVLSPVGNGHYALNVDVVAIDSGAAGNIGQGTNLSLGTSMVGLVEAVAASDFDGGADVESNAELLERAATGIATPNLGSRLSIKSSVIQAFPAVQDVTVVGAGQAEMRRDRRSTLGISGGGKTDIYVRTRVTPQTVRTTKTARLISSTVVNGTWRIEFTRDEHPGFYGVRTIRRSDDPIDYTLEVVQDTRVADRTPVPGRNLVPEMTDQDSIFSRFQTVQIDFTDPKAAEGVVGDTQDFEITLIKMPELAEIHDYLASPDLRHPGCDLLVRAAVPCLVGMGLKVLKQPGVGDIDQPAIRRAAAEAVNQMRFGDGALDASRVIAAVQPLLPDRTRLQLPVQISGEILIPGRNPVHLYAYPQSNYELRVPQRPTDAVTPRTVFFACDTNDIAVSEQTAV